MKFTDFKQKDLVGKLVVWTTSNVVRNENAKIILPIVAISKAGFQIENYPDKWFSYAGGFEKLINGSGSRTSVVSYCELITEEDAQTLKQNWIIVKQKSVLIDTIISNKKKLFLLDVDSLQKIIDVMTDRVGLDQLPSFELKAAAPSTINNVDVVEDLSSIIEQLQLDSVQLIKKHREQLSLLKSKIKTNGK